MTYESKSNWKHLENRSSKVVASSYPMFFRGSFKMKYVPLHPYLRSETADGWIIQKHSWSISLLSWEMKHLLKYWFISLYLCCQWRYLNLSRVFSYQKCPISCSEGPCVKEDVRNYEICSIRFHEFIHRKNYLWR